MKMSPEQLQVRALQLKLDAKFYGEMIITIETLSKQQIADGKWRVANYGGECDTGSTYKVGTIEQITDYVNSIC